MDLICEYVIEPGKEGAALNIRPLEFESMAAKDIPGNFIKFLDADLDIFLKHVGVKKTFVVIHTTNKKLMKYWLGNLEKVCFPMWNLAVSKFVTRFN